MHKILALWAVPRSTSTAFEWMMAERGDMVCLHEPFGEAWYQGEEPLWPRVTEDSLRTPGLTLDSVWRDMQALAEKGPVFSKDFPHYIIDRCEDQFISMFNHSFLIRDPAKTITSMFSKWPDFHPDEVGFKEQRQLFDLICDRLGYAPPVIDSDDLLDNPEAGVAAYCEAVGIPFVPEALSWEQSDRQASWWDGGSFHQNLNASTGLTRQARKYVDITETPEKVQACYAEVLPHYEHLYAHRLNIPEAA